MWALHSVGLSRLQWRIERSGSVPAQHRENPSRGDAPHFLGLQLQQCLSLGHLQQASGPRLNGSAASAACQPVLPTAGREGSLRSGGQPERKTRPALLHILQRLSLSGQQQQEGTVACKTSLQQRPGVACHGRGVAGPVWAALSHCSSAGRLAEWQMPARCKGV